MHASREGPSRAPLWALFGGTLFFHTLALAASLDAGFGAGGRVLLPFAGAETANSLAVQADGAIVVAGGAVDDFAAVVRFRPDGALDPAFGVGGRVLTPFTGAGKARAVAIQADGRIVVAGGGDGVLGLVRYQPDGSLDTGFGAGGRVLTPFDGAGAVRAVLVQPDARIVVVAQGQDDFAALVRYLPSGALDPSFGAGGRVLTPFVGARAARAATLQTDGRIVVAGDAEVDFVALVRYRSDGTLDSSFGSGGRVLTSFTGGSAAQAVALTPGGGIVVAGGGSTDFAALARYLPSGALDPAFGAGGFAVVSFAGAGSARDLAVLADGDLVVLGDGDESGFAALVGLTTAGVLDETFGVGGRMLVPFFGAGAARKLAVEPGSGLIVLGDGGEAEFAALVRLGASGVQAVGGSGAASAARVAPELQAISSGCPLAAGMATIRCRYGELGTMLEGALLPGHFRERVTAALSAARSDAELLAGAPGGRRPRMRALRTLRRLRRQLERHLRPPEMRDHALASLALLDAELRDF